MSVYVRQSFCYKWYLNIWDNGSSTYFEYYTAVLSLNFPYDLELTRASHIPHSVINYFLEIRSSLVAGIGAGVGISLISFVWRVSGGGLAALEQRGLLVLSHKTYNIGITNVSYENNNINNTSDVWQQQHTGVFGLAALEQRGLLVLSPARNTQNIQHYQQHLQWKQKYQPLF